MNWYDDYDDFDDYDDYDDDYDDDRARHKKPDHSELIKQLSKMRTRMCGIGTNRLKRFLNARIKAGDKTAELYRTALELEDVNIRAKKYKGDYSVRCYNKKEVLLSRLCDLCRNHGDILYGCHYDNATVDYINSVMYFELPGCEQISFHCHLNGRKAVHLPTYPKEWDEKVESTLPKLEAAIMLLYGADIAAKYKTDRTK